MTEEERYDVAIAGAGPAGSALAALLARAGRRVALFERETVPRDKLCGEFLSPEALRLLGVLGCREEIEALGPATMTAARLTSARGREVRLTLPGEGWGLSRRAFDAALLRHAERCGACVFTGAEVREVDAAARMVQVRARSAKGDLTTREIAAAVIVGAHGRRDRLDHRLGREFLRQRHPFVALQRHHRPVEGLAGRRLVEELSGAVEIHALDGGYCGVSPIQSGEVNVCALLRERLLAGLSSRRWSDVAAALGETNPALRERLAALRPSDRAIHAVAQVGVAPRPASANGVLLIGDAAGAVAPFCGDGQAMALRSAELLAGLLLASPATGGRAALERRWRWLCRREFALRIRLGGWLQGLMLRPWAAEAGAVALNASPALAGVLVRLTRGA